MTKTYNKSASTSKTMEKSAMQPQPLPELNPNIPAFIAKLWHMVDDSSTNELIFWGKDGTTFVISDHVKFAAELLPHYYKHNNMASFIRQLNMYGFHKVHNVESSSMKYEKMDLEFYHPAFVKGQLFMLYQIKRKMTHTSRELTTEPKGTDNNVVNKLLHEVTQLRSRQEVFESKMSSMKNENDALWREHSILRQKHVKQQKIVNKLIQFLVTLVQQTRGGLSVKRRVPLMIKDNREWFALTQEPHSMGPVICEVDPMEIMMGENGEVSVEVGETLAVPPEEVTPALVTKTPAADRPKLTAKRKRSCLKRKHSQVMESPGDLPEGWGEEPPARKEGGSSPVPTVSSPASNSAVLSPQPTLEFTLEEVEDVAESSALPSPPLALDTEDKSSDLSLVPTDPFPTKEDADNHLEKIQSDLDLLRDVLKGEGLSLDANTLLELFSVDDPLSLNLPKSRKEEGEGEGQELMSYAPSLVDMSELGLESLNSDEFSTDYTELNTPQISMSPFDFFALSPGKDV